MAAQTLYIVQFELSPKKLRKAFLSIRHSTATRMYRIAPNQMMNTSSVKPPSPQTFVKRSNRTFVATLWWPSLGQTGRKTS